MNTIYIDMNPYVLIGGLFGAVIAFTPVIAMVGWLGVFAMLFTLIPIVTLAILRG